jgi:two-component system sensor histidine kinase/response regulator
MKKSHILLVEDTDSVREVLTRQLEALGVSVTALADGDGVKQELENTQFDLVIADLHLPNCSGVDIARFAKAKNCKIFLMSGDSNVETRPDLINGQFEQILSKPVTMEKLQTIFLTYGLISDADKIYHSPIEQTEYDETGSIHLVSLQEQMGELDESAIAMLLRFPDMMRPLVTDLENSLLLQDLKRVVEIAHSLKGAAKSAGAHILARICEDIQNAANENRLNDIRADELQIEFVKVDNALQKLCKT